MEQALPEQAEEQDAVWDLAENQASNGRNPHRRNLQDG